MLEIKRERFRDFTLTGLLALFLSTSLQAQSVYSELVIFGDSLSDPGNAFVLTGEASIPPYEFIPDAPYTRGGHHFTNGETWIEKLAKALRRNTGPAFRTHKAFANYAVGGARARDVGVISLTSEVGLFIANTGGQIPDDALYTVFIGGNDIRDAIVALTDDTSGATSIEIIEAALTAIYDNLSALIAAGATDFLIVNGPDLSLVPAVAIQGPQAQQFARILSIEFNTGLASMLDILNQDPAITIKTLDIFALFNNVVATPEAFGLDNVETTCITPYVIKDAVCPSPDTYLFWDGIHPTRAGHQVIADKALSVLGLP